MMSWADIASGIAVALTIGSFVPYIRAIRAHAVKPHFFSWLIWTLTTLIVFFAQLDAEGGAGAWPTGASGVMTVYVAWLALVLRSDFTNTRSDWVFLIASLLSLPLWYATDDPLWSVVILTAVDTLGFAPTVRKAWARPHEESLLFYSVFVVRNVLSIAALASYTWTTVLFPAVMVVAGVAMCWILLLRRQQLPAQP